jgi:geranylgeranyl diphosphate synthase type II
MLNALQLQTKFNEYLSSLNYVHNPEKLYEPIHYVLSLGGKRIRPILMMMAYQLYKDDVDKILNQAVGIEMYHNFTLLHDDLMDCADKRRGNPTVHVKWNNNAAILSGDAMTILAYQYMSLCDTRYLPSVLKTFTQTALEICEGQQMDMDFEIRDDVSETEYIEMIRLKTAVLLAGSLKIGAILGGAFDKDASLLYDFGIQIGLAFQLQDDYLDVYGDVKSFGKNIGGDILCNKKTYLLIKTIELADDESMMQLKHWLESDDKSEKKIKAVTDIYNKLDIASYSDRMIQKYYVSAMHNLEEVEIDEEKKSILKSFAENMMHRYV